MVPLVASTRLSVAQGCADIVLSCSPYPLLNFHSTSCQSILAVEHCEILMCLICLTYMVHKVIFFSMNYMTSWYYYHYYKQGRSMGWFTLLSFAQFQDLPAFVRGHPRVPTSPTEYPRLKIPNTFHLNDTPYIPPHRRQLYNPYPNPSPSQPPFVS